MKHTRLTVVGISLVASMVLLLVSATLAYSSGELKPLLTVFFNCNEASYCVSSTNAGTGGAIYGANNRSDGTTIGVIRGFSFATNGVGVWGRNGNTSVFGTIGVRGQADRATSGYGGFFDGFWGAFGTAGNRANALGVYGFAGGTNAYGVRGYSSSSYGGFFQSGSFIGLTARGSTSWYDAYFPNRIRVRNTIISPTGMAMDALNNGGEAVGPGDVVVFNGFVDSPSGPMLAVKKANGAEGTAVVGVVQSALAIEEVVTSADVALMQQPTALGAEVPEGEPPVESAGVEAAALGEGSVPTQMARFVEGAAAPGQNLTILIQGIAKVKVDASGLSIRAGDALVASGNAGFAASAAPSSAGSGGDENAGAREGESESGDASSRTPSSAVGRALESLEGGTGEIYVLVGAH